MGRSARVGTGTFWVLAIIALAGCGSGSPESPSRPVTLVIDGPAPSVGSRSQLTAVISHADDGQNDVTRRVHWYSSRPAVATVDAGLLTGISPGWVRITAIHSDAIGSSDFLISERMFFTFTDPVGDHAGPIDVTSLTVDFDRATGEYEIGITADDRAPFLGDVVIYVNVFNADTGTRSRDPSSFSDSPNYLNCARPERRIVLTGTEPRLRSWKHGDRVATSTPPFGNPEGSSFFRSSVCIAPYCVFRENEDAIAYGDWTVVRRR